MYKEVLDLEYEWLVIGIKKKCYFGGNRSERWGEKYVYKTYVSVKIVMKLEA